MLDIKFIRENADLVKEGVRKKQMDVDVDRLIEVDDKRRQLLSQVEEKRAQQNTVSEKIAQAQTQEERNSHIEEMRQFKQELQQEEEQLKEVMQEWQQLMVQIPNVPDISVPEGDDDDKNQEMRTWGQPPQFSFTPQSHADLMRQHDMADFERGAKVAGFRGYFLKNAGAELNFALWNFANDFFKERGNFTPVIAPAVVNREAFLGTGYLPQGEEDLYKTQDEQFLAGTSEVALMSYHMDETIEKQQLPIKYFGFSPCYRREAGSHGKDTKGLMRVHEFYKFEQVILCEASHEESVKWHEWINENTEAFIQALEIPHRTVVNCGGDLGLGQVKKYDIELWVPSENTYREISSASYFHDFQSRRLNIRYSDDDGKKRFVHSLNCTAAPTPRIMISLLENNQNSDGTITVPAALQPYMKKEHIGVAT
jgi:seryl-tRNA synthetase